jgi:hypothetical protein
MILLSSCKSSGYYSNDDYYRYNLPTHRQEMRFYKNRIEAPARRMSNTRVRVRL